MTKYFAIDADGGRHTRSTERTYTHTVVSKGGYEVALASARHKAWKATDISNYNHDAEIAAGRDRYPYKAYLRDDMSPAERQAELDRVEVANAARVARAKLNVDGRTVDQYVAIQLEQRIKRVEERKAKGEFEQWVSVGWCGRYDLAMKLAAKEQQRGADVVVAILEAQEG